MCTVMRQVCVEIVQARFTGMVAGQMRIHARKSSRLNCIFQLLGKRYLAGVAGLVTLYGF